MYTEWHSEESFSGVDSSVPLMHPDPNDTFSDFPKETLPKLTYFFIIPLEMQTFVEETSSSISGCLVNSIGKLKNPRNDKNWLATVIRFHLVKNDSYTRLLLPFETISHHGRRTQCILFSLLFHFASLHLRTHVN